MGTGGQASLTRIVCSAYCPWIPQEGVPPEAPKRPEAVGRMAVRSKKALWIEGNAGSCFAVTHGGSSITDGFLLSS